MLGARKSDKSFPALLRKPPASQFFFAKHGTEVFVFFLCNALTRLINSFQQRSLLKGIYQTGQGIAQEKLTTNIFILQHGANTKVGATALRALLTLRLSVKLDMQLLAAQNKQPEALRALLTLRLSVKLDMQLLAAQS